MDKLLESFLAFNENAAAYLSYAVSNNLWYLLIIASAVICIAMNLKAEIEATTVEEEQAL